MKITTKILAILIFCGCLLFLGKLPYAKAVNTGTVGILPAYPDPNERFSNSWFIYHLDLGKSKEDAIRVINNKEEAAIVKLYAVDATVTTDGGFALLSEDDARKDVGAWVKLALNEVEVPPKSEKLVPFTITIPKDADAGDHAGGIILQEVEGKTESPTTGTGVKIVTRVGVRIYETVPGEVRRDSSISRFDWQMQPSEKASFIKKFLGLDQKTLFFLGIENKGNVKISPKAKIEVKNMIGRAVGSISAEDMGVVFPRTKTTDSVLVWQGMPVMGRYTANLEVDFGEGINKGNKEIVIWAIPYRIISIILFLLVLTVLARLTMQYFKEVRKERMPIYGVKPGDTLASLSQKFQVNWKKLARTNSIKKPFEIKPGQKLFIPMTNKNFETLKQFYRQQEIERSIAERSGAKKKSRKKLVVIIIILVLIIGGTIVYRIKFKKPGASNVQDTKSQESNQDAPKESAEKTASGVAKKSAIIVKIYTLGGVDPQSSQRLRQKLDLSGYQAEIIGSAADKSYSKTTIEHSSGSIDQAKIVQTDIGLAGGIDLKEVADLGNEIRVYNKADKEEFLEIGQAADSVSAARELINIKVTKGGASDEAVTSLKELLTKGDYTVDEEIGQSEKTVTGVNIMYSDDDQKNNVDNVKDFLEQNNFKVTISRAATSGPADTIIVVAGK